MSSCAKPYLPLTTAQQELWLAHETLPEKHPGINCGGRFVLNRCPEPRLIRRALGLLRKHFPLLTATLRNIGQALPVLETGVHSEPAFQVVDLRRTPHARQAAQRYLERFREQPFTPLGGRLFHYALVLIDDDCSWFLTHYFHVAGDGFASMAHVHLALQLYEALRTHRCLDLGPACLWDEDVEEDRTFRTSKRAAKDVAFWREYLAKLPPERLFKPRLGCPDTIETIGHHEQDLSPETAGQLRELAAACNTGPAEIFMALHAMVLARLYDGDRLGIQVPLRFGERRDIRRMQGHRVNIAPLILDLTAEQTFGTVLEQIRRQLRSLLRHARTPFQHGLRAAGQGSVPEHVWDTNVNYLPNLAKDESDELRVRSIFPITSRYEPVLMGVYLLDTNEGTPHLSIDYSRNHFTGADAARYVRRMEQLLAEVRQHPDVSLTAGHALLPAEHTALAQWQQGPDCPFDQGTIPALFDRLAARMPDRTAVLGRDGTTRSYRQLKTRSDGLARWLTACGMQPGQVVAVLARRHPHLAETILAIMKAGAVYLPVDPDYPSARIRHILDDSGAGLLLALEDDDTALATEPLQARRVPAELPAGAPPESGDPAAAAYLIYTSGSTGRPKGVLVPHCSFVNMIQGQMAAFGIRPADRVLQFASPSFDASLSEMFMALLAGAGLCPVERALLDEPWALRDYMAAQGVTVATLPPSYLRLFNRQPFPGLRVLITAGEVPVVEDARHYAAQLDYFNAYGPTEASVCASLVKVAPHADQPWITIGRPLPNTCAYILDSQDRPVAPGLPGELCLAGASLALGYHNRPELNRTRFGSAPAAPGQRLYRTGDRAAWTNRGEIVLLGRVDDQVKIRGHRVEPGEVAAVLERHPAVARAAVLAVPATGGRNELVACLVTSAGPPPTDEALASWLRERLPVYMLPARWHLLDALPVTPTGKIDRAALTRLDRESAAPDRTTTGRPGSAVEEDIRALYEAVLERSVPDRETDFFALGGDSLKAMELVHRLTQRFDCRLAVRDFLADTRISTLARMVARRQPEREDVQPLVLPLSQGQTQLWTEACLAGPTPRYNMPFDLELRAPADDAQRFAQALLQALVRQPSCRCAVSGELDAPLLQPADLTATKVERLDLRDQTDPAETARQLFDERIHQPFDLTHAPLFRLTLARLDEDRWQLLLVMHHIIGDGESLRILLRDTVALLAGKTLPAVSAEALRHFVEAEKLHLSAPGGRADLTFWQKRLTPLPARLDLVPSQSRPPRKKGAGDQVRRSLGDATSAGLRRLAESSGVTLLEGFIGLLLRFLRGRSRRRDVAVAVPIGLRDAAELFDTVGYFVNTVIVRGAEPAGTDLNTSLRATGRLLREAVTHSRYPFALLPEALGERRDPARAPLADVMATHIDTAALLPDGPAAAPWQLAPLDVSLRAAKLDFTFILHSRPVRPDELILEYDSDLATAGQAEQLLAELAELIERAAGDQAEAESPPANATPQEVLTQAWQEILGGDAPGPASDFFACGGDSIKAIQLVGLLRRRGVDGLIPARIFERPTLGALAEQLAQPGQAATAASMPTARPGEPLALLPIQQQLLRQHPDHWRAFHMALPMRLGPQVDEQRLRQAVRELPLRHEALRTAFAANGSAQLLATPPAPLWDSFDAPATADPGEVFGQAGQRLFARLDPAAGRLCGAVLARCGEQRRLLLFGGHHLALDAVSLDILCRELAWYCCHGNWPPQTREAGAATWALALATRREQLCDAQETAFWQRLCATPAGQLEALQPDGRDRAGRRSACRRTITGLGRLPDGDVRSDLLAALAHALHARGQTRTLFVTLEGHGREALVPGLDISQAIGWFTVTYPLPLSPSPDLAASAADLARWFEQLPHGGAGYGLAAQHSEGLDYRPQIALNYLGRPQSAVADDGFEVLMDQATPDALPGLLHEDFRSDAPLDLLVYGSAPDTLQLTAWYAPQCLADDWVAGLLDAWAAALQQRCATPALYEQLAARSLCTVADMESVARPNAAQQSMLFQHLLDSDASPTYTQQITFRLAGELDPDRLEQAWHGLTERHESLRSLFPTAADETFYRLTLRHGRGTVDRIDLTQLPAALQAAQQERLLRLQRETPFDLAAGPLLRLQLFCLGPDEYDMSWYFHHLLMDGWCVGILLRELFAAYAALSRGEPAGLTPAPPLSRYRRWQQQQDKAAARSYWRDLLRDRACPTLLAPHESAAPDPAELLRERELRLDAATSRALQAAAARLSATLPNLLQALWGVLLDGQHNGQRDVLYGLVVSGRPAAVDGIEDMVGLFIRTLPVRLRWPANQSLAGLVEAVQSQAVARAPHEFYPLADIQRATDAEGALFDHILVFENYPLHGIARDDAPRIEAVSGFEQHPYAFGLSVVPGEELLCRFSYRPSRFDEERIGQLQQQWHTLLQAVAEAPQRSCEELAGLLQPEAAAALPAAFNDTARSYPRHASVGDIFHATAQAHAASKALIGPDGRSWSYRELDRVSDAIAAGLPQLAGGEPVALAMPRGPEAVAAMLGILKAGGSYLPLDEKSPSARIANMLRIASCRRAITHPGTVFQLDRGPLADLDLLPYEELAAAGAERTARPAPNGEEPAYVMFTSGSTGEPKGVVVPHRAILRLVVNSDFWDIAPGERLLQAGPLGFDASTLEIWGALLNGGTVCFIGDDELLSPGGLKRRIASERITLMWLTASLCNLLADEDAALFAPLRRLFTGGEALSPAHMGKIMAACPKLELCNGYGPTENTTFTTVHRITAADLEGPSIPIGRPVANSRVHILDAHDRPAAIGQWGEICAAGDGLALGYIGRDELTRAAFVELPSPIGERVYRTGDIGRWRPDGVIEFQGRRDEQVKVRGYRIELTEIELALNGLPHVQQAAVVAPGRGENRTLVALVRSERPDPQALRAALEEVLPRYMIPDRILCLDTLPLTKNGKLDRAALARLAEAGPRRDDRTPPCPAGRLEQDIAAIFGEVLGVAVASPEADFFRLGGHSLKAMRLLARLNHRLDAGLCLRDVMTHTTVAALARRIRSATASHPPAEAGPVAIGEQPDYPLSSGQERLWFLQHMQPDGTAYNVPFAARLAGAPDRTALQRALTLLEKRHEALRLRMPDSMGDGALRQRVAAPGALRLDERDLSTANDPAAAVAAAVEEERARPFAFGYDRPLARACLLVESTESAVLLLNLHHLICDGWSGELFLKELTQAYAAALEGTTPDWPKLPLRYVDYACWQRDFVAGEHGAALLERWRERLVPLPEALQLPTDKPRPPVRTFQGAVCRFALDTEQLAGLRSCAQQNGTTLFPVLAALVATFLYRHTGQEDLVVGVPVAGRTFAQMENLFGFFVNTVPLRQRLNPERGFQELVNLVRTSLQEALDDQLYPLETLVNDLNLPREGSRNPLFDVLVAFEEAAWNRLEDQGPLAMRPYALPHRHSKLDLSFYFREMGDDLTVDLEYSTDLFEAASVERMAERLRVLIDAVLRDPGQALAELAIMPAAEREQVVRTFNDTAVGWRLDRTIDQLFARQVRRTPHGTALRAGDGSVVDFAELDRRVTALAGQLQAAGVVPGTCVGVCFERSVELMTAIFAVLRAGGVYVPFVPGLPTQRMAAMAEDLGDGVMLAGTEQAGALRELGLPVLTPGAAGDFRPPQLSADAAAYIIFTSGSTGRPKGVVVEHHSVLNRIWWMQSRFPLRPDDVILQKTSISFDVSVWELFWWSWTGASLAQLAPGEEKDPAAIVAAVARHGATVMHFVPSMLRVFLDHLERHAEAIDRLASLRLVFASGEALTPEIAARFNRLLHTAHGTELHNLYGPTEATVDVTWYPCSPAVQRPTVPIGRPVSNTRMYVLDKALQPVPVGVAGELFISGVQVARGYINRPELTAQRFLADPFQPGDRMYRTGDLGRWLASGDIEYLGRCDDQVKVRGFRIELGEVEAALERLDSIAQAVVRVGQVGGMAGLEAFLVATDGADLSLPELRRQLGQQLPDYMIPAVFYGLDSIPLNNSGKADRKALRGRKLAMGDATQTQIENLSATQQALTELWRAVLPEAPAMGPDDNFFDLGGNSLLLIRLHEQLQARWPGCFTLAELFVSVTVRQQAARIDGAPADAPETASPSVGSDGQGEKAVAVIGMALRLGDMETPEALWADLLAGSDRTGPLPPRRRQELTDMLAAIGVTAQPEQLREAAFLEDISGFDCQRFAMSPSDARLLDPEQRLFLETVWRALEDAGYGGRALNGADVGIFVGASPSQTFKEAVSRSFPERVEQAYILNVPSSLATRVGYLKDWSGPASLIDTACSSALKALRDACQALQQGECNLAVAGGARVLLTPLRGEASFQIETSTGQTRTFDALADGVGAGEGAVAFLLKPLRQALADGDSVRAVILGGAINQDGRSASIAAPNPVAQAAVIRAAAADAGIPLDSIDFFEAHGTGTALGDPIEIDGLTRAFAMPPQPRALIGSVKGNVGHLDAAAGAIGVAKAILTLQHGVMPRQPHFERPNPRIDFDRAPVAVARDNCPLDGERRPWRCGVSAFGLSGINAHLLLQQAPARQLPEDDGRWYAVPLSAGSTLGLRRYAEAVLQAVAAHADWPLQAVAATLITGREPLRWRLVICARTRQEFLDRLMAWCLDDAGQTPHETRPNAESVQLAALADEGAARRAGQAFLAGAEPVWPDERPVLRVHLPAVPMERMVCWPRFVPQANSARRGLLGAAVDGPQGRLFPVPVADAHFWPVAEHRLGGHPTLVGMAMIALLAEAMAPLPEGRCLAMETLSWLRPLVLDQVADGTATLTLQDGEQGRHAVLGARQTDGAWVDFAEAGLCLLEREDDAERLDPAQLRAGLSSQPLEPETLQEAPVQVSARWDCRQRLWRSADGRTTLALLSLPEAFQADLRVTPWHPALLDVAASLALDRPGLVPARCGRIVLHKPLTPRLLAHVVRQPASGMERDDTLQVDCRLLNEQGELLAELCDLLFVPLPRARARLHRLEWRALPPGRPETASAPRPALLVIGEGARLEELRQVLAATDMPWRHRPLPKDDAARAELAAELLDGEPLTCLYLVPERDHDPWTLPALLQTLVRRGLRRPLPLLVAGAGALDTTSGAAPEAALDLGTLLAVTREEPLLQGRYVELAADVPAAALLDELTAAPPDDLAPVRLTAEGRFVQELTAPLPPVTEPEADPAGCVVITGGLGAMALTLAENAFGEPRPALALLHRGTFPPEQQWPQLAEQGEAPLAERAARLLKLREQGIPFRLYACDVTDRAALARTLQQVRAELDAIGGVLHTAGVAGDGFLLHKSRATFESVLAPKVDAVRHLHDLTRQDPLRFFVLASSRTALTGAPGQSDYTAANAYLDAFAHWRRHQGLPALALDWNSWDRIGMAARHDQLDPARPALPPEQAGALLRQALASGAGQLVVSMPGETLTRHAEPEHARQATVQATDPDRPLEQRVLQIVAEGLGYDTPLSPEDDFYALGGDSITGLQIVNRINRELERSIGLADLFSQSQLGRFVDLVRGGAAEPDSAEVPPAPARERYPVSWEQLAVLQAEATATPHTGYNLPQFLRLPANCDLPRLTEALTRLVARHEILRTRFGDLDRDLPYMQVLPAAPVPLAEHFVETFDQAATHKLVQPFDLSRAPLFRAGVLHTGNEGDLLFLDIHHAVADARTIDLLLGDLWAFYRGEEPGPAGPQQKDAAWLQHEQQDVQRDEAQRYWLRRFEGELPLLELPADHERPCRHSHRGATARFDVPAEWLPAIRELARELATTTYNLMLSLWSLLLGRYADRDELVMAVAADGRDREALAATTGMFVSLLPLRLRLAERETFAELLLRNHHEHADALRFRSFPLNRLLNALRAPVMPDRTPLAEVTFSYMNFDSVRREQKDFAPIQVANPSCKADLAIFATDLGEHLSFALEYYADLFDAKRMQRMGEHFLHLLEQLIGHGAHTPLADLALPDADEQARIAAFEAGPDLATAVSLEALLQNLAPHLEAISRQVAARLTAAGVAPGEGVWMQQRVAIEQPALLLGVMRAGACALPSERPDRTQARWALADDGPANADLRLLEPDQLLRDNGEAVTAALAAVPGHGPALVLPGDNGQPLELCHDELLALAAQLRECGLQPGTRVGLAAPLASTNGLLLWWGALLAGAQPASNAEQGAPPELLLADAACLTRSAGATAADGGQRLLLLADEPPAAILLDRWANAQISVALRAPGAPLLLSVLRPGDPAGPYLPAGRPAAGMGLTVRCRHGRPVPIGLWGRVQLSGPPCHDRCPASPDDMVGRWRTDGVLELRGTLRHSDHDAVRLRAAVLALDGVDEAEISRAADGGWHIAVTGDGSFDDDVARRALRRRLPVRFARLTFAHAGQDQPAPPEVAVPEGQDRQDGLTGTVLELFRQFFEDATIGPDDSFFDLGGHSLLALQMINRIARQCGCELTIRDLFEHPSAAELATLLAGAAPGDARIRPVPDADDRRYPLSHAQQRLYVLHHTDGGAAAYNMAFVFRIDGPLDTDRLHQALARLCTRHEVLRTALVEHEGRLWQQVEAEAQPPLQVDQLAANALDEALALCRRDATQPFDLRVAPLFRVRVCRLGQDDALLSLVMHHIVGDGWSMQLFFGELLACYAAGEGQPAEPLPALDIQYRDYAVWQQGRNWQEESAYWQAALKGAPTRIALPADAAATDPAAALGVVRRRLPEPLMARLRDHARAKGVSLATLCLTLFSALLYRLTRQGDMVIGMGVAGRERAELEHLIGFFINILPIRVRLDDDTDLDDLLDQVHRACLEALERQDYPFDLLVRDLAPDRSAQREALINVMFEYQRFSDLRHIIRPQSGDALHGVPLDPDGEADAVQAGAEAKYDLTLFVQDEPGGCRLKAEFDPAVLSAASVTTWLEYLESFMNAVTQPQRQADHENI